MAAKKTKPIVEEVKEEVVAPMEILWMKVL